MVHAIDCGACLPEGMLRLIMTHIGCSCWHDVMQMGNQRGQGRIYTDSGDSPLIECARGIDFRPHPILNTGPGRPCFENVRRDVGAAACRASPQYGTKPRPRLCNLPGHGFSKHARATHRASALPGSNSTEAACSFTVATTGLGAVSAKRAYAGLCAGVKLCYRRRSKQNSQPRITPYPKHMLLLRAVVYATHGGHACLPRWQCRCKITCNYISNTDYALHPVVCKSIQRDRNVHYVACVSLHITSSLAHGKLQSITCPVELHNGGSGSA